MKKLEQEPSAQQASKKPVRSTTDEPSVGTRHPVLDLQRTVGNSAVAQLLQAGKQGQSLEATTRAAVEPQLGENLGEVRVHTGPQAARAAQSMDAAAFTVGQDVVFGADKYAPGTPAGDKLLAHELAHTVQQRHAETIIDDISSPADQSEQSAEAVGRGEGTLAHGDAVPAIQRQPADSGLPDMPQNLVSRADVTQALTDFLYKALQEQGGQDLRVTPAVRTAVLKLFEGDHGASISIEAFLNSTVVPGSPAEFAREVTKRLPDYIQRSRVAHLPTISPKESKDTRPKSAGEAAGHIVDTTVAPIVKHLPIPKKWQDTVIEGARSAVADGLVGIVDAAMGGSPIDDKTRAAIHAAVEAAIKEKGPSSTQGRHEKETSPYYREPPASVAPIFPTVPGQKIIPGPVFKFDLPSTPAPPKPSIPQPAQVGNLAEIEKIIQSIDKDALVPPEARGKPEADEYAQAQDLAHDLANRIDAAHKKNNFTVELTIGFAYGKVNDVQAIFDEIARIAHLIVNALPHHASNVGQLVVKITRFKDSSSLPIQRVIRLHESS